MDRILNTIRNLKTSLADIVRARREALSTHDAFTKKSDEDFKKFSEQLEGEFKKNVETRQLDTQLAQAAIEARTKSHAARTRKAAANLKVKLERQINDRKNAWAERRKEARDRALREHEGRRAAFETEAADFNARLDQMGITVHELKDSVLKLGSRYGVRLKARRLEDHLKNADANATLDTFDATLATLERQIEGGKKSLSGGIPPSWSLFFSLVVCVLAWLYFFQFSIHNPLALSCAIAFIVACIVIYSVYSNSKERVQEITGGLLDSASDAVATLEHLKAQENDRYMAGIANLGCERVTDTKEAEDKAEHQMMEDSRPLRDAMASLQDRRDKMLLRVQRNRDAAQQKLAADTAATETRLRSERAAALSARQEKYAGAKRASETERAATLQKLAADWKRALGESQEFLAEIKRGFHETHPAWTELKGGGVVLPIEFIKEVPIGAANVDIKTLAPDADSEGDFSIPSSFDTALPVTLEFPLRGSVFIRAGAGRRDDGMNLVSSTVLNLLRSFPPGKTKLTIIDPVGLGQNFAGLMHLADYDETLVNGRIWSEGAHIDRKLTELTEHMEKVIQKFLRNRYPSIDDYNKEAGQMAEPYRFVVIGDFPMGFSEMGLERLASIIKSGVRCGVYTIILYNSAHKLPPHVDLAGLKQNGVVLADRGNGFVLEEELLNFPKFEYEALPSSAQLDTLVNSVGKQCREASRVQVPFEVVLPKPEEIWSSRSDLSVRVPLGKSGADRLQHLELGRGTAQHALIAGKTGSGKSNLFHVIITNAATWYSPRELEFYLIDFKKGVEFKTYGVHRLRHARVVAIESDREFALSVLQRIDRELTIRGELFRKARVQDFPSFRKACPNEMIPRTLLMIDEFQEFFTDDDSVAQDAALLLDRIVRQGRAFGIHVILGSQTLGGTYTLSKSTLGQVVVRIALQCSEQDSYLVLSDDNAAASLLTRPGDAIYNDMAGQIEGNNPFQAVWLPKDKQDGCLATLQRKAVEGGLESVDALVVFEGNSLSDLRSNMVLRDAALREPSAFDSAPHVWFGEPNAIKGPTEAQFGKQAGANLLVIGHRGDTEMAMCCATVVSLAAQYAPDTIAIRILDGARPDSPARERLNQLKKILPHDIEIYDYRSVPQTLADLAATVKARQDQGAAAERRIFVLTLGLEKFRMLRQEDDFSFGSTDDAGPSASKAFVDLLTEGPNTGIHSIVWCDTLSNLNRSMSRKTLREFEMRVLFQMSASDSSELIDSPAANRLGMYNALFYSAQNGAMEKFRPYEAPDREFIEDFGRMMASRNTAAVPSPTA